MEQSGNSYCRFCAEPKTAEKLLNLQNDDTKYNDIQIKLAFLNAIYVDVSNRDTLPKTVCFVCYDSLNKAYEFLDKVKNAQNVLTNLFGPDSSKCLTSSCLSEDERIADFDDFDFLNQEDDIRDVKQETDVKTTAVDVKIEPKEESSDSILQDTCNVDSEEFRQTLNVQDILDAALCNAPYGSAVTIYGKEVSDVRKSDCKFWKDYQWQCAYCDIEFMDVEMLRSHSKVVHSRCSAFICIDCKSPKGNDFNSFLTHVRRHRKLLRNTCIYCDEHIEEGMVAHVREHFLNSETPCPACGEVLKNEETLRQHLLDYLQVKPKRKPRRKAGTPITIDDLTCHICKKVLKNPNSLRDHIKRHTSDRSRNYTCDRCGKAFFNQGTLTSHIMSHDEIRPYLCRICNKSFLFPNILRRHVEMHSGVKPFACNQCGRNFRLKYQLKAHEIVHTDAMPYVCQYCNKAFRFKQILKNHERQHTGAKPYSCQHCGMEFANWSNYNKHMKRRHGTDTSKKKITPDGVFPINPETGQIVQNQDQGTEEWKSKIMKPAKRGKKKVIKQENMDA